MPLAVLQRAARTVLRSYGHLDSIGQVEVGATGAPDGVSIPELETSHIASVQAADQPARNVDLGRETDGAREGDAKAYDVPPEAAQAISKGHPIAAVEFSETAAVEPGLIGRQVDGNEPRRVTRSAGSSDRDQGCSCGASAVGATRDRSTGVVVAGAGGLAASAKAEVGAQGGSPTESPRIERYRFLVATAGQPAPPWGGPLPT